MAEIVIQNLAGVLLRDGLSGPASAHFLDGVVVNVEAAKGPGTAILVPAFTNAHSHLEYYTLMGKTVLGDMGAFLNSIVALKLMQSPVEVREACALAAAKNREAGVSRIWEHSDRPGSAQAMAAAGLKGIVQKEVMDFFRPPFKPEEASVFDPYEGVSQHWGPHAPYSIRGETLRWLSSEESALSIHCAESLAEVALFADGSGGWETWRLAEGMAPLPAVGMSPVEMLKEVGFLQPGRQLVHCCAVTDQDIELMSRSGVSVAHCPRSNKNLDCPIAPIRRMREAGIRVGIGLDSAASSGEIDFFAEMREAVSSSRWLGEPLSISDVWHMACYEGADAMGADAADGPWMLIQGCSSLEEALLAAPEQIVWVA